jgi:prepilin-type N-terminal cleavage/methylation domain-containing protein
MKTTSARRRGFSLIEVIITVGVISFALVGLMGIFPLALEQSRNCIDETRSAQMARMVFATLAGEPFDAAECFGPEGGATLNLEVLDKTSPPVVLYASYGVENKAAIVRTDTPPGTAEYRLELRFELATMPPLPPATGTGPVRGTLARLQIVAEPMRKNAIFETSQFIDKSSRGAFAKPE